VTDWGSYVAVYAAGVATVVGYRQVRMDMPRVMVTVRDGATLHTAPGQSEDITSITVTNAGRRPIVIVQAGYLPPKRGWISLPHQLLFPTQPGRTTVPFTLGDGEYAGLILELKHFTDDSPPPPEGAVWFVQDSRNTMWPRKARWTIRWRRLTRRNKPTGKG
jgi:hypothetical protein